MAKSKKLKPNDLRVLALEMTAAARALVEMGNQMRDEAGQGPKGLRGAAQACDYHHLIHDARELNVAVCAVVQLAGVVREEMHLAARKLRSTGRRKRKLAPKCHAWKASGGRCGTRLRPGQFRCPLHAQELRKRRKAQSKGGGGNQKGGAPHGTH